MTATTTSDQWLNLPQGRIFARRWQPLDSRTQGKPIMLLHDSLGCVDLWRDFPHALCHATRREVIAYDRLGFGRSDARIALPSLDFIHEEVRDCLPHICKKLGLDGYVALGHSVGGGMSIQCAADHANRCEALVTLAAQVFPEDRTLSGIRAACDHFRNPEQLERLAKYHGDKARWVLNAWTETWLHPDFSAWSLVGVLGSVHCPTLAIHGEQDEYGSIRHPELIERHCSGPVRVEILSGVGHMPQREQPQTVLELVSDFLK
ncbi:alpha/beta fold hydrolase [Xanthomonas euvesicatoria]|uniref:alpha/beta fold hydrolase n=1 Tax=Xanthomonas euvesicatoria TaxID=456327 RepID=UPI001C487DDC|nr:alpha/beta hydrolase [Xanthomonas euvesicatoria]MBV6898212.1 alpha/beta hydrolase [Xanthomonas campestris pv. ionidii]